MDIKETNHEKPDQTIIFRQRNSQRDKIVEAWTRDFVYATDERKDHDEGIFRRW